jgi:hypothetical protein
MSEPDEARRGVVEQALSYTVYAPLGFALEARGLLPRFIERGRSQILLARVVGKYAVRQGAAGAEGVAIRAQEQALALLRRLGLVPAPEGPVPPGATPAADGHDGGVERDGPPTGADTGVRTDPPVDPATLAIPDYDSLSASQVVPRLAGLTGEELELVRAYEAGTRGRKTILNRIAQLQSA